MAFKHSFLTWIVAHLLHLLICIGVGIYFRKTSTSFFFDGELVMILVFSLLCSVPCLLLAWPLLLSIISLPYTRNTRFGIWLIALLFTITIAIVIIMAFMGEFSTKLFELGIPALVATGAAVLIRHKQFQNLIDSTQPYEL